MCEHPNFFSKVLRYSKIKKMWCVVNHLSKNQNGILLLIVRFVKSSDQTIIQIIRKNRSILKFLINPSNCFTGTENHLQNLT